MRLNYFEIHLTDHCNLNCQSCDNFSSISEEFYLDEASFDSDFERLSLLAKDRIGMLRMLGGEPLLHPNIVYFLKTARKYFQSAEIRLTTNGIKLSTMPAEFWLACMANNITIEITFYPININIEKINQIAQGYNVRVIPFNNMPVAEKLSHRNPVNDKKDQDIVSNFRKCYQVGRCMSLKAGKIYPCTCIPNICHFNKFFNKNLEVTEKDCIDIYKVNDVSEIESFLNNPVPFCAYCNVSRRTGGKKWAVTQKDIFEWFDEN